MLHKYQCKVQPRLCSKTFPYFEQAFGRFRILDKWFYFYMNDPKNHVIVWKSNTITGYQLQPGTNRYIGVALRNSDHWIDGMFVTDNLKEIANVPFDIKILQLVDSINLDMSSKNFYHITLDNPAHRWGIETHTSYKDNSWYQPVWNWIYDNLKYSWGLEYNGKIYHVNCNKYLQKENLTENIRSIRAYFKKPKTIVRASDFPNVQSAVRHLFELIKTTENLIDTDFK